MILDAEYRLPRAFRHGFDSGQYNAVNIDVVGADWPHLPLLMFLVDRFVLDFLKNSIRSIIRHDEASSRTSMKSFNNLAISVANLA